MYLLGCNTFSKVRVNEIWAYLKRLSLLFFFYAYCYLWYVQQRNDSRGVTYANLVFQFLEKLIITQSINQSRSRYRAPVEIALGIYKLQGPRLTYALTATKLVVTVVLQTLTHLLFLNENLWIRYSVSVWCILITKADKQKQKQKKNKKKKQINRNLI